MPLQLDLSRDFSIPNQPWKHRKSGGYYKIIGFGVVEATGEPAVIYTGQGSTIWIRPAAEFFDGRFGPADLVERESGVPPAK